MSYWKRCTVLRKGNRHIQKKRTTSVVFDKINITSKRPVVKKEILNISQDLVSNKSIYFLQRISDACGKPIDKDLVIVIMQLCS